MQIECVHYQPADTPRLPTGQQSPVASREVSATVRQAPRSPQISVTRSSASLPCAPVAAVSTRQRRPPVRPPADNLLQRGDDEAVATAAVLASVRHRAPPRSLERTHARPN